MKELWQHKVPQGTDVMHEEEVKPLNRHLDRRSEPYRCDTCGKAIIRVDENEGPEALKSLLRF